MRNAENYFYLFSLVAGFVSVFFFWHFWNMIIPLIFKDFQLLTFDAVMVVIFLLLNMVMLSLVALLITDKNKLRVLFTVWSVPFIFYAPSLILGLIWVLMSWLFYVVVAHFIKVDTSLYIKPVIRKILIVNLRNWFILFSFILSLSLVAHPQVQIFRTEIEIPNSAWAEVWDLVQTQFASPSESTPNAPANQNLINSFTNLFSGVIKEQVETTLNSALEPIWVYWPYIVGISFFLTVIFIGPLLVYLVYFMVEIVLKLLIKVNVVQQVEEQVTATRYVLKSEHV